MRIFKREVERPVHPQQPKRVAPTWENETAHLETTDFISLAAAALQEAMNVAAADMDANGLMSVAKEWTQLAEANESINNRPIKIGFRKEEQD